MSESKEEYLTLDLPQREGKEGYVGTMFSLFLRMGSILGDANFKETDMRIEYMVHFMISLVPGKTHRQEIREDLKRDIEKALKVETSGDTDTKARIRNMICLEYIGIVGDFIDKHIGVSRENKIGFAVKRP
jgi:hypothetical protein